MAATKFEKIFMKSGKNMLSKISTPIKRCRTTNMIMEKPRQSSDSLVQTATIQS
jgi:hypothetical protein